MMEAGLSSLCHMMENWVEQSVSYDGSWVEQSLSYGASLVE